MALLRLGVGAPTEEGASLSQCVFTTGNTPWGEGTTEGFGSTSLNPSPCWLARSVVPLIVMILILTVAHTGHQPLKHHSEAARGVLEPRQFGSRVAILFVVVVVVDDVYLFI